MFIEIKMSATHARVQTFFHYKCLHLWSAFLSAHFPQTTLQKRAKNKHAANWISQNSIYTKKWIKSAQNTPKLHPYSFDAVQMQTKAARTRDRMQK